VNAADGSFGRIVKLRVVVTALLQFLHAFRAARAKIIQSAEDNRFSRANFGAGWHESAFLPIITESTFEGAAGIVQRCRTAIDHPKWT
jgi:hypothetical protein